MARIKSWRIKIEIAKPIIHPGSVAVFTRRNLGATEEVHQVVALGALFRDPIVLRLEDV